MANIITNYFSTIRNLLSGKQQKVSVGIDIGAGDCKMVELALSGEALSLINWAIEPIRDKDISSAVKTIMGKLKHPCKRVYSSVFGKGTLIRYLDMPNMSLDELKKSFSIEADKYFPFSLDEVYIDCCIISPGDKGKQMYVMAAAAKKEIIDKRVEILQSLGLSADFIGINSVALANVVNVLGLIEKEEIKKKDTAIAILDMGASMSSLIILVENMPWFIRDIFIGGDELTKRISNFLGISFHEAERLKKSPGHKLEQVINASEAAILNFVQELTLSFNYFSREKNKIVTKLFLTGGGCMLDGICSAFERHLEVKVQIWNPLDRIDIAEEISKEDINLFAPKMGVALGLALYDYDRY